MFGQTAKFGKRTCLFHTSIIGIKNKLTKQTVKNLMRRPSLLDFLCLQICVRVYLMSEFTRLYPNMDLWRVHVYNSAWGLCTNYFHVKVWEIGTNSSYVRGIGTNFSHVIGTGTDLWLVHVCNSAWELRTNYSHVKVWVSGIDTNSSHVREIKPNFSHLRGIGTN